jgi:hypothetical protein
MKSTGKFASFLRIFPRILVLGIKTKRFEHTWMNWQEKKIQELKLKNRELTRTKIIFKLLLKYSNE